MNSNDLTDAAIAKTITVLAEHNLKYKENDLKKSKNKITVTNDYVIIELSYLYGWKRGKILKSARKILKKYKNISFSGEYVAFYYSTDELRNEDAGVEKIPQNPNNVLPETTQDEQSESGEKEEYNINRMKAADMAVIEKIAEKYNTSLKNLARVISQKNVGSRGRVQVRFSEDEAEIINARAKKKGMNWSRFCRYACGIVLNEYENMKDISLQDIQKDYKEETRNKRMNVLFSGDKEYERIRNFAARVSLPISTFIRYCMLKDE